MMGLFNMIGELFVRFFALFGARDYAGVSSHKLGKALIREMKARRRPLGGGFQVPAVYYVYLGQDDFYIVKPIEQEFTSQLLINIVEHVADGRYTPDGKLDIVFELDDSLRRGQFFIIGKFSDEEKAHSTPEDQFTGEKDAITKRVQIQTGHTIEVPAGGRAINEDTEEVPVLDLKEKTIEVARLQSKAAMLRVVKGGAEGQEYQLEGDSISVGRSSMCDIRLFDKAVSRVHAYIRHTGEGYIISDFGSKNGTYVNDKKIQEIKLTSGDRIRLGETVLVFEER